MENKVLSGTDDVHVLVPSICAWPLQQKQRTRVCNEDTLTATSPTANILKGLLKGPPAAQLQP